MWLEKRRHVDNLLMWLVASPRGMFRNLIANYSMSAVAENLAADILVGVDRYPMSMMNLERHATR